MSNVMPSEHSVDFYYILLTFILMILTFLMIKRYWLAWIIATIIPPILGIILLGLFEPLAYYAFAILPIILLVTGIISGIIGGLKYYLDSSIKKRINPKP